MTEETYSVSLDRCAVDPDADELRACGVPRIDARDWSADAFFAAFVRAPSRPVLVRGGLDGWPLERWRPRALVERYGDAAFVAARDPFRPHKGAERLTIREQIAYLAATAGRDRAALDELEGAGDPYMFPDLLGDAERFPLLADCPLPALAAGLEERLGRGYIRVSLQLGAKFSHTGLHFHGEAFNALVFGRKRWFLHAPLWTRLLWGWIRDERRGPRAQLLWLRHLYPAIADLDDDEDVRPHLMERAARLRERGLDVELEALPIPVPAAAARGLQCFQEAGEILFVPLDWGHWVVNYGGVAGLVWEHIHPRRVAATPASAGPR
ncbi:MAG: cupin-like domain-containing protein [Nannocystaceae bacterium]